MGVAAVAIVGAVAAVAGGVLGRRAQQAAGMSSRELWIWATCSMGIGALVAFLAILVRSLWADDLPSHVLLPDLSLDRIETGLLMGYTALAGGAGAAAVAGWHRLRPRR